mgnify:CR=1 FL=1
MMNVIRRKILKDRDTDRSVCDRCHVAAISVTEQVFTTQISAFSPLRTVRTPASRRILPIVEVSENSHENYFRIV